MDAFGESGFCKLVSNGKEKKVPTVVIICCCEVEKSGKHFPICDIRNLL